MDEDGRFPFSTNKPTKLSNKKDDVFEAAQFPTWGNMEIDDDDVRGSSMLLSTYFEGRTVCNDGFVYTGLYVFSQTVLSLKFLLQCSRI